MNTKMNTKTPIHTPHLPSQSEAGFVLAILAAITLTIAALWALPNLSALGTTAPPSQPTTQIATLSLSGSLMQQMAVPAEELALSRDANGIVLRTDDLRIDLGITQPGSYDLRTGNYALTVTDTLSSNRYAAFDGTVRLSDNQLHIAAWLRDANGQPLSLSARLPLGN